SCPAHSGCARNGGCDCNQGYAPCDGGCAALSNDDLNCGACGKVCDATTGYACVNGTCLCGASAEWGLCPTDGGSACVDTLTDPHNCASCGHDCGALQCVGGTCS